MFYLILVFIFTLSVSATIGFGIIKLYTHFQLFDDPQSNHHIKVTHTKAVPRGGGLIIFLSVFVSSLLFLQIDKYLIAILLGALLLTIIGTLDDIFDLKPGIRIITGLLAALIVVGSGIGIAYITNPFTGGVFHLDQPRLTFMFFGIQKDIWIIADFLAILFIVWNMNIVNWSKGVDGQMPGFVSISLIFIGLLSNKFLGDPTSFNTSILAFIISGAFVGLLIWNWYPQKIMPGYGGGSLAGYFLAIMAIISGAKFATVIMVLAIPTADGIFTILRRIAAGKSPLWGDREHLHHKLLDVLKRSKKRVSLFYLLSSLFLGILSLYLTSFEKLITLIIIFLIIFYVLFWLKKQK